MIDVREESMVNGDIDDDIPMVDNLNDEDEVMTSLYSDYIGSRHLLKVNGIRNYLDPVSGKRLYKVIAQLFDKSNLSKTLGEKSFFWPENEPPHVRIELKPKLLLIVKGKKNVAELPFNIPRNTFFSKPPSNKISSVIAIKSSFNGSIQRTEISDNLLSNAREFVTTPDEDKWKNLVKCCSSDFATITSFITPDILNEEAQLKLFDALLQKFDVKQHEGQVILVFNALLKSKILSANIFSDVVRKLVEIKNFKLLFSFIKCPSTLVMDDEYVSVIKFALESNEEQSYDFFVELVTKGFTIGTIRKKFAKELNPKETIELLNWCINILDQKANEDVICEQLLDLMLVLLDSQCDKLILDDECYSALKRAKDYVQSMTEMTTAFTRLLSKNKAKTEIPELEASPDTDFIVEKVKFVKTKVL